MKGLGSLVDERREGSEGMGKEVSLLVPEFPNVLFLWSWLGSELMYTTDLRSFLP